MRVLTGLAAATLLLAWQAAPAVAGTYFSKLQTAINLPVSNTDTTLITVSVPAGTYEVSAVINHVNTALEDFIFCDLYTVLNAPFAGTLATNNQTVIATPLQGAVKLSAPGTISLGCRQQGAKQDVQVNGTFTTLLVKTATALK